MNMIIWTLETWARIIGLIPIKLYGGGGGTSQDFGASNLFATSARNRWNTIKASVWPIEDQLMSASKNGYLDESMKFANDSINDAFAGQRGALQRDFSRMGVTPNSIQQNAMDRSMAMQRGGALVNVNNTARRMVTDRKQGLLSGGVAANKFISKMGGGGV
jgi:hypothetical protein